MTALDRVKEYTDKQLAEGRQISFAAAFATSRPALKHIRYWFPDVPAKLSKAEATEWLAEEALKIEAIRREISRLSALWSQAHYGDDEVRASGIRCEIEELESELEARVNRAAPRDAANICNDCGRPMPRGVCERCGEGVTL